MLCRFWIKISLIIHFSSNNKFIRSLCYTLLKYFTKSLNSLMLRSIKCCLKALTYVHNIIKFLWPDILRWVELRYWFVDQNHVHSLFNKYLCYVELELTISSWINHFKFYFCSISTNKFLVFYLYVFYHKFSPISRLAFKKLTALHL